MPAFHFVESTVRTVHPTKDESRRFVIAFLKEIIGQDCVVTPDKRIESWTSFPHGSGTTEDHGPATPLQIAADAFLKALSEDMASKKGR